MEEPTDLSLRIRARSLFLEAADEVHLSVESEALLDVVATFAHWIVAAA
jgi:hypothetical protein